MPTPHQVELKSHALVARLTCTWCKMESEEEHESGRRKVHAFMQDSTALVWDAQDVVHLREKWRIMGSLIGALPSQPRQNAQLGLPLKLMPEETTLLLELGVLELLEYAPPIVTEDDVKQFNDRQKQDFENQEQSYLEKKKSQQLAFELGTSKLSTGPSAPKKPKLAEGACAKGKGSFSPMVSTPTVDSRPLLCYTHYDEWTFPATETEKLKYAVFHDLWLKGYFLTSGLKYGGDYLVYRDNPNKVHSDFIAIVTPWQQSIGSIVSLGRLGSKVKKTTLLCSVEGEKDPVRYVTLQWSGIT